MTGQAERSITYQPALDGLRAVAVILVLLFHLGFSWMTGGYLGVSVFFTLSGYLITTLLVNELNRSGEIRLRRFYGRRARRLLPASLVSLAGACILIATRLAPDRSGLRWYIFGGLFQFANWVPLGLQNSYAELFNALSPTDHFWSLAIEEQFYWVWPVTMLGLFRLVTRRSRAVGDGAASPIDWTGRLLRILLLLFAVFAISAPLTARLWNTDAAYFATWARIPEILAGAVLAVAGPRFRSAGWVKWLAPAGLAVIILLAVVTPAASGFAYNGALPVFGMVSAGLIAGLQHPSAVTSLLSQSPLVFLGRISYGVYLYHWPVFVVLTEARTGLSELALSALRVAVTIALSVASFYVIEQPIRERRFLPRPRLALAATGLAIPIVALLGFTQVSNTSSFEQTSDTLPPVAGTIVPLVTGRPPTTVATTETTTATAATTPVTAPVATTAPAATDAASAPTAPDGSAATATTAAVPPASSSSTTTIQLTPARPVRMLVIGDSTALATGAGLIRWADSQPHLAQVEVIGFGGCGLTAEGDMLFQNEWIPAASGCVDLYDTKVPQRVRDGRPDIVVIIGSFWEVTDHRLPGDETHVSILNAGYRDLMTQRYVSYGQLLLDSGAPRVVWVLYPETDYFWEDSYEPGDDPARYGAFYDVQRLAAQSYPGVASTIDFASWSDAEGLTTDHGARLDGVHWTPEVATDIAAKWLGNEIIQTALR